MKVQLLIMAIHDIGTAPNPTLSTMLMSLISWIAYPEKHVLVVLTVHKKYQISRHPLVILPLLSYSLCVCICAFILRCLLLNIIFQFASGFLRVKISCNKNNLLQHENSMSIVFVLFVHSIDGITFFRAEEFFLFRRKVYVLSDWL